MKWLTGFVLLVWMFAVQAEMLMHPDDNTLWLEDGNNIKISDQGDPEAWNCRLLAVRALPEGGFSIGKPRKCRGTAPAGICRFQRTIPG